MEDHQGSVSPRWSFNHLSDTRDPRNRNRFPMANEPGMPFSAFYPLYHDPDENAAPASLSRPRVASASVYEPAPAHDDLPLDAPPSAGSLNAPNPNPYHPRAAVHRSVGDGLDQRRRLTSIEVLTRVAPLRFVGDGFDFRRPVRAVREQDTASVDLTGEDEEMDVDQNGDQDVIDLTADDSGYGDSQDDNSSASHGNRREGQERSNSHHSPNNRGPRLPRGMDIIIDLDNGDEEWAMEEPQPADPLVEPPSPEIEFISSRRIFPPHHPPSLNRSRSDGDEVEFIGANPLSQDEVRRRRNQELDNVLDLLGSMNGRFTHLRAQVDRFNAQVNHTANRFRRGGPPVQLPRAGRVQGHVRTGTFMAPRLDFDMVAFDLGIPGGRAAEPPPPPTYDAPPKAPEGFTRSPEEKDELVCPNCGGELCCGPDDLKKQVWIVKSCGHVCWLFRRQYLISG